MSIPKRPEVRIANPAGGCGWTSHKRAQKLIARGRARSRPDLGENVIEILITVHHEKGRHTMNLEVVSSSSGTRDFTTFGGYPMFPREFMRVRFQPALHSMQ